MTCPSSSHSFSRAVEARTLYNARQVFYHGVPAIHSYLLHDHMDLLLFLDEDHIFLHPQGLCFTCSGFLCQIPILQIILISFTSHSETPMRLLPLPLKTSPQTSSGNCSWMCPRMPWGPLSMSPLTRISLCVSIVLLVWPSQLSSTNTPGRRVAILFPSLSLPVSYGNRSSGYFASPGFLELIHSGQRRPLIPEPTGSMMSDSKCSINIYQSNSE